MGTGLTIRSTSSSSNGRAEEGEGSEGRDRPQTPDAGREQSQGVRAWAFLEITDPYDNVVELIQSAAQRADMTKNVGSTL